MSDDIVLVEEMDLCFEERCDVEVGESEEIVKLKESDVILKSVESGEGWFICIGEVWGNGKIISVSGLLGLGEVEGRDLC